jgi:hypothetical protein
VVATAILATVAAAAWAEAAVSGPACDVIAAGPSAGIESADMLPIVLLLAELGPSVAFAAKGERVAGGESSPPVAALVLVAVAVVASATMTAFTGSAAFANSRGSSGSFGVA